MPYPDQELSFTSRDGRLLRGELMLPATGRAPFLTVVLQQGSVLCDRDGNVPRTGFRSTLYRRLARMFAERGIASFRYDKREFDLPAPTPLSYSLTDRVDDLIAAYLTVRAQPEVGVLNLLGHSEGGVVAQLASARWNRESARQGGLPEPLAVPPPARLVVFASPAVSLLDTMSWRVKRYLSGTTRTIRRKGGEGADALSLMKARLSEDRDFEPDEFEAFKAEHRASGVLQGWESWPWLKEHGALRITDSLGAIPCPTLYMQGEHDRIVSSENLDRYRQAIAAAGCSARLHTRFFPDVGHSFEYCSRKAFVVNTEAVTGIADWLLGGALPGHSATP